MRPDIEIDYVDNVPCIDFISSLRTGLFSLLDGECVQGGTSATLVEKLKTQHISNGRYFNTNGVNEFGIKHFVGNVVYSTVDFLESNCDQLADDIITVFHKSQCSFGFVSHLFGAELRILTAKGVMPRGVKFRVAPTSHLDQNSLDQMTTLTQDFHTRLDNLLRTLVHARPHFIRCIKINDSEQSGHFDKPSLMKQIRALQILETVNLMSLGLPHRMRFKAFVSRYRLLVPSRLLKREEDKMTDDCNVRNGDLFS